MEFASGEWRRHTAAVKRTGEYEGKLFRTSNITSQSGGEKTGFNVEIFGQSLKPSANSYWKTNEKGMTRLAKGGRLLPVGNTLTYKRLSEDFPVKAITNWWDDTVQSTFAIEKDYVVQTYTRVVERCLLMTTDPGDLVLDPTCGSRTTAFVAEKWGRRWITCDTSRVAITLAKQRLAGMALGIIC